MSKLLLSAAKPAIAEVLGVNLTDSRIVIALNDAQQRLLNRAIDPVGSWLRYRVCINRTNCVTLPRQVLRVMSWWHCNQPGLVLPEWYESLGWSQGGRGLLDGHIDCTNSMVDRGSVCCFDNVASSSTSPHRIQVLATHPSDNGKSIILRYYDSFEQKVYTTIDGSVQEGERLTLSTAGVRTAQNVMTGGLYQVIKPVTNYPVRLYSWDSTYNIQDALLALYEPSETSPLYRSYYMSSASGSCATCGCGSGSCTCDSDDSEEETCCANELQSLTLAVRLRHIPVVVDNDPLIVENLPALRDMVQAQLMKKRHEYAAARELEQTAMSELDGELAAYLGGEAFPTIRTPDSSTWGPGGIFNPVGGGWGGGYYYGGGY